MRYLDDIDGLGPKFKELLEKLNIYSVEDLISYYPRKYNVIRRTNMDNIEDKAKVIIDGLVEKLRKELKVPVFISDNPLTNVAEGTGILLDNLYLIDN